MAYHTGLEGQIDRLSSRWKDIVKKKMFGGVGYLIGGNMAFGIWKDFLIVRMDKEEGERRLRGKNVVPFDITGKPMAGWVMVQEAGWMGTGLAKWLAIGKAYALSLPAKTARKPKKKTLKEYSR